MKISATLDGIDKAIAKLGQISRGVANKSMRKAVRAGVAPQLKAVRSRMTFSDDTGTLRRSMTTKIKTYASGVTSGVVGPRKQTREIYSRSKRRVVTRNPNAYAHLVESGHRIAVSKDTGKSERRNILIRKGRDRLQQPKLATAPRNIEARSAGFVQGQRFMERGFAGSVQPATAAFRTKLVADLLGDAGGST